MEKKPARKARDVNQLAKAILDTATGEGQPETGKAKDPAAVALGRKGGLKGGKARAAKLTPAQRKAIAKKAVEQRWANAKSSRPQS